jgi:uncharacterized protein YdaU (DUF1376 family)
MVNWYKRDPDRALNGMVGLTLEERGAYNTILDLLYSRDGVVPNDDAYLLAVLGCHGNQWRAVKKSLIAKGKIWVDLSGNLSGKRVEKTLKEAGNYSETQSKRATKGWEKRKKFNVINHPSMPLPALPSCNASTTTTTTTEEEKRSKSAFSSSVSPSSGTPSERAPEGGELASALGGAHRSPPPVAPPPQPAKGKEASEEEKRLAEQARARQAEAMRLLEMSPHERREFARHAQGNGRERVEALGPVVAAGVGPGQTAQEPDVSQPEQPGIHRLDGLFRQPHEQSSAVHAGSEAVGPAGDIASAHATRDARTAAVVNGKHYATLNSPEQRAWEDHLDGVCVRNEDGGYEYPSRWPPGYGQARQQGS